MNLGEFEIEDNSKVQLGLQKVEITELGTA